MFVKFVHKVLHEMLLIQVMSVCLHCWDYLHILSKVLWTVCPCTAYSFSGYIVNIDIILKILVVECLLPFVELSYFYIQIKNWECPLQL